MIIGIDPGFFPAVERFCGEVQCNPFHALDVWYSESGCKHDASNGIHAVGLFQAIPSTLAGLGFKGTWQDFAKLSASEQVSWAVRYYGPHKGRLGSVGAMYTATFLPAELLAPDFGPEHVLVQEGGHLGWAYALNSVFDANKDHIITVAELEDAVDRNCRGPRFDAITAGMREYLGLEPAPPSPSMHTEDVNTVSGLQTALRELGFYHGDLDGIPGRLTWGAVLAFQKAHTPLVADGIPGPATRPAIVRALAELPA